MVWAVRSAGGSLGLPDSVGAGSLRGVVPEQQAEVDTWVVMEFCNRGTLQVGRFPAAAVNMKRDVETCIIVGVAKVLRGTACCWHYHGNS